MSFVITEKQMEIFHQAANNQYIDELVEYFWEEYPYFKKSLNENNLRKFLSQQITQAKENDFTQKGTIQFYIELRILFGTDFEKDYQYSWMNKIIQEYREFAEVDRSMALYTEIEPYLERVHGRKYHQLLLAYSKLESFLVNPSRFLLENKSRNIINLSSNSPSRYITDVDSLEILELEEIIQKNFELASKLYSLLESIYSLKFDYLDDKMKRYVIASGIKQSQVDFQASTDEEVAVITLLIFMFGQKFDQDPFFMCMETGEIHNEQLNIKKIARIQTYYQSWLRKVTA